MSHFAYIKKHLQRSKKKINDNFIKIQDGILAAKHLTRLTDEILKDIFKMYIIDVKLKKIAICAVGGYGRSELAPYSDIDILFILEDSTKKEAIEEDIRLILYKLWDLNYKIGYSVRKIKEIYKSAIDDQIIATSLLDCRFICGNYQSYKKAKKKIKSVFGNQDGFIKKKIDEQEQRLSPNRETSYLLEPDIKNSQGGLRDLNLVFWFFKVKYQTDNLDILLKNNIISHYEFRRLVSLRKFLIKVRFYVHLLSGRSNNRLTLDYQKKIAIFFGYKSKKKTLGVEKFMRHFYLQVRASRNLLYIVFENSFERKPFDKLALKLKYLFTERFFVKKHNYLSIVDEENFLKDPKNILYFLAECSKKGLLANHRTLRQIFNIIHFIDSSKFQTTETKAYFLQLLIEDRNNEIFEVMHEVGIIPKVLPKFSKILCQAQFDQYHLYTVDQHTIKAIRTLKKIDYSDEINEKFLFTSEILRRIKNKKPLYVATLLHDIGKGYSGSHNKVGAEITNQICKSFDLTFQEIEEIKFLISRHQKFSDLAFKSDLEDKELIKEVCSLIKKTETLMSLFVLTVIDISSVNESVWTNWKQSLLIKLFKKCEEEIFAPNKKIDKEDFLSTRMQESFESTVVTNYPNFKKFSLIAPENFWLMQSPKKISQQIDLFFNSKNTFEQDNYELVEDSVDGFLELTIVKKDRKSLLLDLAKTITLSEMKIFEARIFTLKNNMAMDIFKISPLQFGSSFNSYDLNYYKNVLKKNLKLFFDNKITRIRMKKAEDNSTFKNRINIKFDNENYAYTKLSVKTNDRPFLLFDVLEAILKFNCEVYSAKILTLGDIVEDIFYIKRKGYKIKKEKDLLKFKEIIKYFVINRGRIVS